MYCIELLVIVSKHCVVCRYRFVCCAPDVRTFTQHYEIAHLGLRKTTSFSIRSVLSTNTARGYSFARSCMHLIMLIECISVEDDGVCCKSLTIVVRV